MQTKLEQTMYTTRPFTELSVGDLFCYDHTANEVYMKTSVKTWIRLQGCEVLSTCGTVSELYVYKLEALEPLKVRFAL